MMTKKYHKVRDHCYYTGKYEVAGGDNCNLKQKTPKEIPAVFHNGSTYDYHFNNDKTMVMVTQSYSK